LNKTEIITVVTNKLQNKLLSKDIDSVITLFIDIIKESLQNNEKISLRGFGTFSTKFIGAKSGNSFGNAWSCKAKYVPKIKFSDSFRNKLSESIKG